MLKFINSEKATKFCEIFLLLLTIWLQYIQSKVRGTFRKILWPSQNIWTLSENVNNIFWLFTTHSLFTNSSTRTYMRLFFFQFNAWWLWKSWIMTRTCKLWSTWHFSRVVVLLATALSGTRLQQLQPTLLYRLYTMCH